MLLWKSDFYFFSLYASFSKVWKLYDTKMPLTNDEWVQPTFILLPPILPEFYLAFDNCLKPVASHDDGEIHNWETESDMTVGLSNFCLLQSAQPSHGNITPLPHLVDETDKGLRSQRTSRAHAAGGITANRQTRQKCSEFHSWRVSRLSSIKIKFIFDIRTNLTTKHASVTSRVGKPDSLS